MKKYCRACGDDNIAKDAVSMCLTCHKAAPERRGLVVTLTDPANGCTCRDSEFKRVLDYYCRWCGAVGGHCESVRYDDEDCDAA